MSFVILPLSEVCSYHGIGKGPVRIKTSDPFMVRLAVLWLDIFRVIPTSLKGDLDIDREEEARGVGGWSDEVGTYNI